MGVAKRKEDRRLMMFEDAHSMWTEGRLPQEQAAELLGVSARVSLSSVLPSKTLLFDTPRLAILGTPSCVTEAMLWLKLSV